MFLKLKTKKVLHHVDMMDNSFYTDEEREEIRAQPGFYGWNPLGYYIHHQYPTVEDIPSTRTAETANRSGDDISSWGDYFCHWLIPFDERV